MEREVRLDGEGAPEMRPGGEVVVRSWCRWRNLVLVGADDLKYR